jgi:hypothetical protein
VAGDEKAVVNPARRKQKLARELAALRLEMEEAQHAGDLDAEYLLLCLLAEKERAEPT